MKTVACIMAGGVGSRFWPASTEDRPKQFLDILGLGKSLLQLTFDRYIEMGLAPEDMWVITSEKYIDLVQKHLPLIPYHHIIGEPARKNTAPAAYLGNKIIRETLGEANVIMAPSDHLIEDVVTYNEVIKTGVEFLEKEKALITIGITPTFPHTGYGYIAYNQEGAAPYKVESFKEKPDRQKAKEFLASGNYLWNAGIFIWNSKTLNDEFEQHSPEIKATIDKHVRIENGIVDHESLVRAFNELKGESIDYEIMERATNVYTIPSDFKWSDLGSWKSLYDKSKKDDNGNVLIARKDLVEDANGNLIFVPGKRIVLKGLKNYMVIEDNDTLVISPIKDNQEVKQWRNKFQNPDE